MRALLLILLVVLTSCSEPNVTEQIKSHAKRGDGVWLCDVDTTSGAVRYRAKQMVTTNTVATQFSPGALLPASGPATEPGTRYGDEAFVFLSRRSGSSRVSAQFILILHGGQTGDGMSREAVVRIIQEEQKR